MANSNLADNEKGEARNLIEQSVGPLEPVDNRHRSWYKTRDNKFSALITFSKSSQRFFDLHPKDLASLLTYPKAFVVFLLGSRDQALIIPAQRLERLVAGLPTKGHGEVKLHVVGEFANCKFHEVPGVSLSPFYNNYSQLVLNTAMIEKVVELDLDSIRFEEEYFEGKKRERWTNHYERNPKLRVAVIQAHGTRCTICKFDFEEVYGEHGAGFSEVHHIRPVNSLDEAASVDPVTDMAVVCSNCHRMIHRRKDNVLAIKELRAMLRKRGG